MGYMLFFIKGSGICWGDDLVREVLQAVNTAVIPEGWNDTTMVMIPKVDNPDQVA